MEVKVNKDIREFTESIFFGLSMRQFIFSICACVMAVILYFLLKPFMGIETLSWVCILGAVPFAVLGFVKYNGVTAEKFISAWFKSEILTPKKLVFKANNIYYEEYKEVIENNLRGSVIKKKKVRKGNTRKGKIDENSNKNI